MADEIKPSIDKYWHELYIESQADPLNQDTDVQFCASINLEIQTFRNWKSKYRTYIFKEVEVRRKTYVNELRSKGHKALAKKLDKDTNAIKLLFQLLGDLVEKTESRVELGHDDQIRRIQSLRDSIGKRQAAWDAAGAVEPAGPEGPKAP